MGKRAKMEPWEEELINQATAISTFKREFGGPSVLGKRISRTKMNYKKTTVATVRNRDAAAVHQGFAIDVA